MSGLIGWDRGVHLRGTPLWFDSERARALAVVTQVPRRLPPAHRRALLPEGLAARLAPFERIGSILPTPPGRWVGVGGQQIQLWPTGGPLSAAALVVCQGRRILISGAPRQGEVEWPKADHLVLPAPSPGFRGASLERILRGLAVFLESAGPMRHEARIQVDDVEAALSVSEELLAMGFEHRRVGWLGKLAPLEGPRGLTIAVDGAPGSRCRVAMVQTRRHAQRERADVTFRLDWLGSMSGMSRLVRRLGARVVTLVSAVAVETPASWPAGVRLELLGLSRQLVFRAPRGLHSQATN